MLTKTDLQKIVQRTIQVEIAPIKKDVVQIRKDQKTIVSFFDHEYLELRNRVERLEGHLHIPRYLERITLFSFLTF